MIPILFGVLVNDVNVAVVLKGMVSYDIELFRMLPSLLWLITFSLNNLCVLRTTRHNSKPIPLPWFKQTR